MMCLHCPITNKMAFRELCGGLHTAQRQRVMKISTGFCTHSIGICIGLGVGWCE